MIKKTDHIANVAIVDDNTMNIELLTEALSELNINIHTYTHPEILIEEISDIKFELFLLDILMPTMSGFELAKELKKNKENSSAPIVFVSALSDNVTKIEGYELGAYTYIEKPYDIEIIKTQVKNILNKCETRKIENNRKDDFVAMLTHDLKSPINAEINALELLAKNQFGIVSNSQKEVLTSIINSAKYMKHITDQILSFYKCKNNYIVLQKEITILAEIIQESIASTIFMFEEKSQQIFFNNKIGDKKAEIDIIEIRRLLSNLLTNASKYSPENSETHIELSMNNFEFIINVKDNGYGIAEQNLENIFDEYISLAKKQKQVGFGLGLNICKKIVEAHNGGPFAFAQISSRYCICVSLFVPYCLINTAPPPAYTTGSISRSNPNSVSFASMFFANISSSLFTNSLQSAGIPASPSIIIC